MARWSARFWTFMLVWMSCNYSPVQHISVGELGGGGGGGGGGGELTEEALN